MYGGCLLCPLYPLLNAYILQFSSKNWRTGVRFLARKVATNADARGVNDKMLPWFAPSDCFCLGTQTLLFSVKAEV